VNRLVVAMQGELATSLRARWEVVQQARRGYQKGDRMAGRHYAIAYLDFIDFAAAVYAVLRWGEMPLIDEEEYVD
jgi:hypothetical protein